VAVASSSTDSATTRAPVCSSAAVRQRRCPTDLRQRQGPEALTVLEPDSESDPLARAALAAGFGQWQDRLTRGLRTMQEHGELAEDVDPGALALGLAAAQGGLLLAQTARSVAPLEAALDLALDGISARLLSVA
jgi:hypothetical protein